MATWNTSVALLTDFSIDFLAGSAGQRLGQKQIRVGVLKNAADICGSNELIFIDSFGNTDWQY